MSAPSSALRDTCLVPRDTFDLLVEAARLALVYFDRQTRGQGYYNGPHDDLLIGRALHDALAQLDAERGQ